MVFYKGMDIKKTAFRLLSDPNNSFRENPTWLGTQLVASAYGNNKEDNLYDYIAIKDFSLIELNNENNII